MDESDDYIAALIELHRGLERQGPGDAAFTRHLLSRLPELPPAPRIADLGCGTGAGTLLLAEWFQTTVHAVDLSHAFLQELEQRAEAHDLRHLIRTTAGDMGQLDWPLASIDLLWSEGAAYNLTLSGALTAWRPIMAPGGLAVISELSWFVEDVPEPARAYWQSAYPSIGSEAENCARAQAAGFTVLETQRLPAQAWWANYYGPLQARINALKLSTDPVQQAVIREIELEMGLFEQHSAAYGYSFYILAAA